MRKNNLVLLVSLTISVIFNFQLTTSLAQTSNEQLARNVSEEQAVRIYNSLSLLSKSDRKDFYRGLTSELKSEIWKLQLRSYLVKHPDLSDKQKQAIEELIVFIKPHIFEIPQDNPDFEEKVNKPVQFFTKKMTEVFPGEIVRELLTVLGSSESISVLHYNRINFISKLAKPECDSTEQETNLGIIKKPIRTQPQAFKLISASYPPENCDCSIRSDWCPEGLECVTSNCQPRCCCGTFLLYTCNGVCAYVPCSC